MKIRLTWKLPIQSTIILISIYSIRSTKFYQWKCFVFFFSPSKRKKNYVIITTVYEKQMGLAKNIYRTQEKEMNEYYKKSGGA